MEAILGAELMVHRDGKVSRMPTAAALAGKRFVALYFSAHWCGPCRKFTPLLSVCYEDQPEKDEVEVVFVSSDHDVEGFDEYLCVGGWGAGAALRVASSPARRFEPAARSHARARAPRSPPSLYLRRRPLFLPPARRARTVAKCRGAPCHLTRPAARRWARSSASRAFRASLCWTRATRAS